MSLGLEDTGAPFWVSQENEPDLKERSTPLQEAHSPAELSPQQESAPTHCSIHLQEAQTL